MIFIILLVLSLAPMVATEPWWVCGATGTYTTNSKYHNNLETLSSMLPASTPFVDPPGDAVSGSDLFAKASVGAVPDTVYALALCHGYVNASACRNCVAAAFDVARKQCALGKDATVFYDACLLRFSDKNFLELLHNASMASSADYSDGALILMNVTTQPLFSGWDKGLNQETTIIHFINMALNNTVQKVFNNTGKHYAAIRSTTDDGSGSIPPIYSMAQCVPELIVDFCYRCLTNISNLAMTNFAGRHRGQILGAWCNLRYDTYPFYGELTSVPSNGLVPTPAPQPTPLPAPSPNHKKPLGRALIIALVAPLFALFVCVLVSFRFIRHIRAKMNVHEDEALIWGLEGRNPEFTIYDFSQVLEATCNFSENSKLGQGGFGPVYKGRFADGLEIAVKRLASHSGQGFTEFKNEIQLIAKLQHTNLVRLLGCCYQKQEKLLIYEYLPNKSLDFFIFDETRRALVDWNKRLAIIDGIAQGLLYLHKHSRLRVIHRDLKASNILLDHEMNPKISDFGLAKIFGINDTERNTKRIVGTYGYMAPEYASEGLFSVKSDVFSFGVLILEIVSGQRTSGFHRYGDFINLVGHAWQLWKEERWLQLVDASIAENQNLGMMRCIIIALLCVQENAADRPTISDVIAMLSSESMTLPEPKHPAYFHVRLTEDVASTLI
ncbi:hypothetical protein SETIT_8G178400v2 [Setaria italica]|uniref:Uncharacterized protein n=1 Tax=Setaria italica TaxID=4555 RepID=A0A368S8Y2_SETIT|nr:hypothetical protein SETIT_8G178400v2 [Setaria italica]